MMTSISGVYVALQQRYPDYEFSLQSDHIVLKDSRNDTDEKIVGMIKSAGFTPFLSSSRPDGLIPFTVCPLVIPPSFFDHYRFEELSSALEKHRFVPSAKPQKQQGDRWSGINGFRKMVAPALNQALSEILAPHVRQGCATIEIGAGIGYGLDPRLNSCVVRLQPDLTDCGQLSRSGIPVYRLGAQQMCEELDSSRKISLMFALNVFDTLPPGQRKTCFSKLAQMQSSGDRLMILLDTM